MKTEFIACRQTGAQIEIEISTVPMLNTRPQSVKSAFKTIKGKLIETLHEPTQIIFSIQDMNDRKTQKIRTLQFKPA